MNDELRAKILEAALEGLRKALREGTARMQGWPRTGSIMFEGLPSDVVKLFTAL